MPLEVCPQRHCSMLISWMFSSRKIRVTQNEQTTSGLLEWGRLIYAARFQDNAMEVYT